MTLTPGPAQADLTDNLNGTVTDTVNGLMWDQCSWGQTFEGGAAGGKCAGAGSAPGYGATTHIWSTALVVARDANAQNWRGHNDWRLPNRAELESLVDVSDASSPAIDATAFPNIPGDVYWSSTLYTPDPAYAWLVNFSNGRDELNYDLINSPLYVRLVRSGQSFNAFDSQACGDGIPFTSGTWQMLALPCVTLANPATPASVFGGSPTLANLDEADYNTSTGWAMYRREVSTTPSSYVKLDKDPLTANLNAGGGYWLSSLSAAANGKLTAAGTGPIAPDTTDAQGCLTGNGCKAVTVSTVNGQNRYNLVGNPFAYPVDWSKVRIRINGSSTTYTPSQAANLATGADAAGNVNPPVLSKQIWIWNGANYDTYDDTTQLGNLRYFQSFWVNVLPAADGQTVELLIPALPSTISQANPAGDTPMLPWYLAWLDLISPSAHAAEFATAQGKAPSVVNWQVRLKLDNHATGWHDHTNLLGQWQAAEPGYDARDLTEMAPFAKPYLTLVFPHPEWGPKAGDYATDFRPALGKQPQDWTFEVRADPVGGVVFLSWEGDAKILKRSRLIDVQTGKTIQPAAGKWAKKGYPITLKNPVQRYVWRYLGK